MTDLDDLLAEQVRYYRERAPEYDATSQPEGDPYAGIAALAHAELRALGPAGYRAGGGDRPFQRARGGDRR
jgi:hypothetical protein